MKVVTKISDKRILYLPTKLVFFLLETLIDLISFQSGSLMNLKKKLVVTFLKLCNIFYVPGRSFMYFTDLCRFLISFGFQVYCTALPHWFTALHYCTALLHCITALVAWSSVGPGFNPRCFQRLRQVHWKLYNRKNQTRIGTGDPHITKQPLNHCAILACLVWFELSGKSSWLVGGGG